jgi:hypothetical protein
MISIRPSVQPHNTALLICNTTEWILKKKTGIGSNEFNSTVSVQCKPQSYSTRITNKKFVHAIKDSYIIKI